MKFHYLPILVAILFSCSRGSENTAEENLYPVSSPEDFPLDSLLSFQYYSDIINMYSGGYDQMDHEKYGKSLHGAWIQTVDETIPGGEISCVSVGMVDVPYMPRMHGDLPWRWQTRAGLHIGMPLDSVQLLNGHPFTLIKDAAGIHLDSWENGQLSDTNTEVYFTAEQATPFSEEKISSQQVIDNGWRMSVKGLIVWKPGYLKHRLIGTQKLPGYYVHASVRMLTVSDVMNKDATTLSFIRNEIFARKGYIFPDPTLNEYFRSTNWYKPLSTITPDLSDIEKANVNCLLINEQLLLLKEKTSLPSIIQKLPVISLPFHMEAKLEMSLMLPTGMQTPDGAESGPDYHSFIYGVLADTSRFYAVVWLTPYGKNPEGSYVMKVTTFTKQLLPVSTADIQVRQGIYIGLKSKCWDVDANYNSIMNTDLSFKSVYSATIKCAQDTTSRYEVRTVSGQINNDGTIRTDENDQ